MNVALCTFYCAQRHIHANPGSPPGPSEAAFGSGTRVYRCLANEIGHQPSVSQFGR